MSRDAGDDDVDRDVATAVGLCAIADLPVAQAAEAAGVTRWELEQAIESADLGEVLGLTEEGSVAGDIDEVLENH